MLYNKTRKRFTMLLFLSISPFLLLAQDGEATFKANCAACHSIGGGKLVGPDLKDIVQKRNAIWVKKFIKNSSELINSGDADAVAIAKEFNNMLMPPSALPDAEIDLIIKYIETKSGGTSSPTVAVDYLKDSKDDNIRKGYQLFTGEKSFKNAGVSCIACHNVDQFGSGGKLAKNLTNSFKTLSADGIKAMLASPAFPAMINSYKDKSLTEDEVFDLTSFLRATSSNKLPADLSKKSKLNFNFLLFSFLGFIGFVLFFYIIWKTRKQGSVNDEIINRQLKTT